MKSLTIVSTNLKLESLIGISSIILLFFLVAGLVYYLARKNFFSSQEEKSLNNLESSISEKKSKLYKLKEENENLNKEVKFLEEKNRRLKQKIYKMKEIINDLQEQKDQLQKSENNLRMLRDQKNDVLEMVAHDIKNPASTIKSFVELLESYDLSAQEQQDVFKGLIETSSRLVNLTSEFSHIVKEEFTPFKLDKKKNDLVKIIERIVTINKVKANEKNIEIRYYQPENDLEFNFDSEKMEEVVDNFVSNAIKFCPEKSKLDIFTKFSGKEAVVEFVDNGYGLTENEVTHIFEKGSKLSTKPTANESSSGLGLWIAKRIIEEHDGKVFVKSKKGFGSTFVFKIPTTL